MQIASIKGDGLTNGTTQYLTSSVYPDSVAGYQVWVTDSNNVRRAAPLQYISPSQLNFIVPQGTAACPPDGTTACQASLEVQDASGNVIASGPFTINTISPSLFVSYPDAWVYGWAQNSSGTIIPIWDGTNGYPSVNVSSGDIYLVLWATGMRFGANFTAKATVAGVNVGVVGIAQSGQYEGIDQIGIGPLPASLAGKGRIPVSIMVGNRPANMGWIVIQ